MSQDPIPLEEQNDPGPLLKLVKDRRLAFLLVGGFNTAFGFGLFTGFYLLLNDHRWGYMVALVIAQVIATVVAFVLYRTLVFRVRGNLRVDFLRFCSVYLVSFLINAAATPFCVEVLGLNPLLAQALVIAVTTLASYLGHSRFSFRRTKEQQP